MMRKLNDQRRKQNALTRSAAAFFGCVLLMLTVAAVSYAQAGRRVPPPRSEPPVPKPAEAITPVKEKPPEPEKISLLVGSSLSPSMNISMGAAEILHGAVMLRLRDSQSLKIVSGDRMSRGEASKRAKNDAAGTHVVWLELLTSGASIDPIRSSRSRLQDVYVQYVVLAPGTGKVKAHGEVYLRPNSGGALGGIGIGRRLPNCYPQAVNSVDYALTEAGIETAERIFSSFSLPDPPLCSPAR